MNSNKSELAQSEELKNFDIKKFRIKCSLAEHHMIKGKQEFYQELRSLEKKDKKIKPKIRFGDDDINPGVISKKVYTKKSEHQLMAS